MESPDDLDSLLRAGFCEKPVATFSSGALKLLKERFTKALPESAIAREGRRKGERGVWQRRFWEHQIRGAEDLDRHIDYIHFNPVKHEYVSNPDEWPYSTWHEWKKEYGRPINTPPEDWRPVHLGEA